MPPSFRVLSERIVDYGAVWSCHALLAPDAVNVSGTGDRTVLRLMGVKLAASMGAEVTMLSTSRSKEADARRLGAHHFALTSDEATFARLAGRFDLILDTISAPHDYNKYLGMLAVEGTMVLLGVPPEPTPVAAFSLIGARRSLAGLLIGFTPSHIPALGKQAGFPTPGKKGKFTDFERYFFPHGYIIIDANDMKEGILLLRLKGNL